MTRRAGPALKPDRNYGIDLLRLVAMMFICILHVCNKGGVVSHLKQAVRPEHYRAAWFLEALTFGAVDIFSMISGYVGHNKRFKPSRPVGIWLELVFYTLLGTLLVATVCPELMPENAWFHAAMPVMNGEYWYMTAYFGMVLLSPILNAAIQKISTKALGFTLLGLFVFYSLIPSIMGVSVFGLASGYSALWLCVMYVAGGFLSKIKKPSPVLCAAVFSVSVLITWMFKLIGVSSMLKYTSPTVIIGAAAITLAFAQLRIRTKAGKAIIKFAAPSALGIFIIHVHLFVWDHMLKNAAVPFLESGAALMCVRIVLLAAEIFFLCFAVDVVRRGLFRLAHIKELLAKLDRAAERLMKDKETASTLSDGETGE